MSQLNKNSTYIFEAKKPPMNDQIPKAVLFYFDKIIDYASAPILASCLIYATGVLEFIKMIFEGITQKDMFMPLIISSICFIIFIMVYIIDTISGIAASKKESKDGKYIKSGLLWSSIWKVVGISVINIFLLSFTYMFLLLDYNALHYVFLGLVPMFMLLATSYEIHSIGENIERMYGKKPHYFNFIEKLAEVLEKNIFNKLRNKLY